MPLLKRVTPITPDARIPDPAAGDILPPEGRTVTWSDHWDEAAMNGDVLVSDPGTPPPDPDADPND